jgi:hypothetical protein
MNMSLVAVSGTSKSLNLVQHYIPNVVQELAEEFRKGLSVTTMTDRMQRYLSEQGVPANILEALIDAVEALDEMVHPYFSESDQAACPCCGAAFFDKRLLASLELARAYSGVPYPIISGYRCPDYDRVVHASEVTEGTYTESSHRKSLAVHIGTTDEFQRARVLYGLLKAGFSRIGLAPDYVHVDLDSGPDKPANFVWIYCDDPRGSCVQRFTLIKSLIDSHVMNFEIGRDYVIAKTYAGVKDSVSLVG